MNILIILNFATVVVAFAVLVWKRHLLFALVALLCVLWYGYGLWNVGVNIGDQLSQTLHANELYGKEVTYPALMGGWTALMLSNVCLALYPWLKRWAVVLWVVMVLAVGIVVGMVSPLSLIEGLFAVCCAIMAELAAITGLTYLDFCTYENIYFHSLLPTVFALPALLVCVRGWINGQGRKYLPLLLSGGWFVLNLMMTIVVWNHYIHLSLSDACSKCVSELKDLGGHTWQGYVMVNVLIYVVFFLVDVFISWLLYRYAKNHCKTMEAR